MTAEVLTAAQSPDPWEAAMLALGAYLDHCCDPAYGRLVWLEGPAALGWHRWRDCERKYAYGLVERFIRDLVDGGYLDGKAFDSLVQFSFWMLGGAGLAVAEAPPLDKPRVRDEWGHLIGEAIRSLRIRYSGRPHTAGARVNSMSSDCLTWELTSSATVRDCRCASALQGQAW